MGAPTEARRPATSDLYRFLRSALAAVRWATLAALLALTLARPAVGRAGIPMWALVALFAGYNLLAALLRARAPARGALALAAAVDLPIAGLFYALGAEPGGLLFVLVVLAVVSASASLPLRLALPHTVAAVAGTGLVELLLHRAAPAAGDPRTAGARLVILALVGALVAILTRRLALEEIIARVALDDVARRAALDRARTDVMMTISHDLRTPLTAAAAALRLLEASAADRLEPDERALLANGRRNAARLGRLIDDLLTLNQLDVGALRLEPAPLDLRVVADAAVAAVAPLLREKGQALAVALPRPLPTWGDARRLEQALTNLLDNAHRHTPPGTRITVAGQVDGGEVRLAVRDTGPGIPPGEREAIFGRLHRLAPPGGAADSGAGLGLAIALGIVALHGGRLWAEGGLGEGAAFLLALPRYPEGAGT